MKSFYYENKYFFDDVITVVLILLGVYLFINFAFPFVAPFVIGFIFSRIYEPFVSFFNKKLHIPRTLSTFLSIGIFIGLFVLVVFAAIDKIIYETMLFYEKLPFYIVLVEITISKILESINNIIFILPEFIREAFDFNSTNLLNMFKTYIQNIDALGSSVGVVLKIPNLLIFIIISFLSSFFFCKDRILISKTLKSILPSGLFESLKNLKSGLIDALLGYFKAQIILMSFTFVISFIGLMILKSPYSLLLALSISIIDALPFFGSGFILWPTAVIFLFQGEITMAIGNIIIYLSIILTRQLLEPKILSSQIGIHPLLTLLSMFIGLRLFGVLGMIIGPILAVILKTVLHVRHEKFKDLKVNHV